MVKRREVTSPLVKHWREVHGTLDNPPAYTFHLVGVHRTALTRQLGEALAIAGDRSTFTMNSKGEFGRNCLISQAPTCDGEEWRGGSEGEGGRGRATPAMWGTTPTPTPSPPQGESPRRKRPRGREEPELPLENPSRREEEQGEEVTLREEVPTPVVQE